MFATDHPIRTQCHALPPKGRFPSQHDTIMALRSFRELAGSVLQANVETTHLAAKSPTTIKTLNFIL
jgi:hypothetical protein